MEGHQTKSNTGRQLQISEMLAINHNKCTTQHAAHTPPIPNLQHPCTSQGYPNIQIQEQTIYYKLQHTLDATMHQMYYNCYLHKKFQWEENLTNKIHWTALQWAINRITCSECCIIIQKFIHKWLPLKN